MPHATASTTIVEHFRHILVWPLQLVPSSEEQMARHWQKLGSPWRKVEDEFVSDPAQFQERHYREFVSFLPHVQHFLYGEDTSVRPVGATGNRRYPWFAGAT